MTRTTKIPAPSEAAEHRAIVRWLSYHPIVRDYYCKMHNEGKRTAIQGHQLKLLGLRSGVSDLFIYWPSRSFHGLWLEVKRNKAYSKSERSTKTWLAQEEFMKNVKSVGFAAEFCYGFEAGIKIIEEYLLT